MKTYGRNTDEINAEVGEIFSVELESVPGAGYQWDADVDESNVKLVSKEFVPPDSGSIGGSGREVFKFKPLAACDAELRFVYKRPWEATSAETVEIKVHAE